jgi:multiple sugar transport system permease protein
MRHSPAPHRAGAVRLAPVARTAAMAGTAIVFVLPLVWMFSASLRPLGLPPPNRFELWPPEATLANYPAIFHLLPFGRYALNSLTVVAAAVPLTLLTASWAGFALAQLPPSIRRPLVALSVTCLLVPVMSLWLTRFLVFKWLGVLDSLLALIVPAALGSSPFYVLILYWAFARLPPDLFEAARVDGCGAFRVWWSIGLPLIRPSLAAVGVLSFVYYWSSFMDPMLYLNDQSNYTLPVALRTLQQLHPARWSLLMAGCVVVTLPVLLVFGLAQRHFLQEHRGSGWLGR